jgi:hypothetical protein
MPRFRVKERRAYRVTYLIDAENEEAAGRLDGELIQEAADDSWADEVLSVEAVADDEEDV